MVRRTDPAPPGWTPMPELVRPMHATPAAGLPPRRAAWGYELRWDGVRAMAYVSGGRLRLLSETDEEITGGYPWLRAMAEALAPTEAVLDGVLVRIDGAGRVRPVRPATGSRVPAGAQYLIVDLLWLEGVSSVDVPYAQRRELLDGLALAGTHWQTPPWFPGAGDEALRAGREQGLPGVVAKRLDSVYEPGRRSRHWLSIDASVTARSDVYLTHLDCPRCGKEHAADQLQNLCECGSPLLARYDLAGGGEGGHPGTLSAAPGRPVALPGAAAGGRPPARHHAGRGLDAAAARPGVRRRDRHRGPDGQGRGADPDRLVQGARRGGRA